MEDALNLATVQPLDVFVNLRTKCLLHYFGLIGKSLNLKVSNYFSWDSNGAKSLCYTDGWAVCALHECEGEECSGTFARY